VAVSSSGAPSEGPEFADCGCWPKTLSELGKRVLLLNATLPPTQVLNRLGLNNLSGLSNLLTDQGTDLWRSHAADRARTSQFAGESLPAAPCRINGC